MTHQPLRVVRRGKVDLGYRFTNYLEVDATRKTRFNHDHEALSHFFFNHMFRVYV